MFNEIKTIIVVQFGVAEYNVVGSANLVDDLGADQYDIEELAMTLEDNFGIEIEAEDFEKIRTVQDVVDYVVSHIR